MSIFLFKELSSNLREHCVSEDIFLGSRDIPALLADLLVSRRDQVCRAAGDRLLVIAEDPLL